MQFGWQKMAAAYSVPIAVAILLPAPVVGMVSAGAPGAGPPIVLLVRSVIPMVRGEWRDKACSRRPATSGFIGMLTIPWRSR